MFTENVAETNRALGIVPPIVPKAPWRIKAAVITGRWTLHVVFNDGTEGEVDLEAFVNAPDAGVFEALRDPDIFNQVHIFLGALTWPGELDLAPDAMHEAIKETGKYIPGGKGGKIEGHLGTVASIEGAERQ
jgi:hypothetical protein